MVMTARHMPAFDQLPCEVRRMLANLDFNWNAEHVLVLHRQGWDGLRIRTMLVQMEVNKHRADAAGGVIMMQR